MSSDDNCAALVPRRSRGPIFGLSVLLAISIALNCLSFWRAHSWRLVAERRPAELPPQALAASGPATSGIDGLVPPLTGKHPDGSTAVVDYRSSHMPTVLYVVSPTCIWCYRNRRNVAAVVEGTRGRFRVVGVSLNTDGLSQFLAKTGLTVELVTDVPRPLLEVYSFSGTPQTIVVSPEGKVLKSWRGAYTRDTQREVEEYFKVQLPGVSD